MGKMKELVYDIIEALEVNDYETVANQFGMTIAQVVQIAKDYGDFDDSDAPQCWSRSLQDSWKESS